MKNQYYEQIDKFIKGELKEPHLVNFEIELINNPEFCKDVRLRIIESDVVNAIKIQNRLDKIEMWRVQLAEDAAEMERAKEAEKEEEKRLQLAKSMAEVKPLTHYKWQKWAIAASILIVFGFIYALFFFQNNNYEKVLSNNKKEKPFDFESVETKQNQIITSNNIKNTENLPPLPPINYKSEVKKEDTELLPKLAYEAFIEPNTEGGTTRSDGVKDAVEKAVLAKKYEEISSLISSNNTDYYLQYLRAYACFKLNRPEESIELYDALLKNNDAAMLYDEVNFNLALCYLMIKPMQKDVAMALMRNTARDSSNPFYAKARVLLSKF